MDSQTNWIGDKYEGEYKEGWYHGHGRLYMDDGVIYDGNFVKGHFHGEGKLMYPNVRTLIFRAATTKPSGKKAKWFKDNTSSKIILDMKNLVNGNIVWEKIGDSTRNFWME